MLYMPVRLHRQRPRGREDEGWAYVDEREGGVWRREEERAMNERVVRGGEGEQVSVEG